MKFFYSIDYSVWSRVKEYKFRKYCLSVGGFSIFIDFNRIDVDGYVYFPNFISINKDYL